ncbi:MAG: hypothetical protein JRC92_11135, partial [Deltaproteobacteria bacterium]|nr:hypothetical protein [Deltaproteobacteria bacterium]
MLEEDLNGLATYEDLVLLDPNGSRDRPAGPAAITARPVWDFEKKCIFLPLGPEGQVRAVARLSGVVGLDGLSRRGPFLARLAQLSLEKFDLTQAVVLDPLTGLFSRVKLLESLGGMIAATIDRLGPSGPRLEVEETAQNRPGVALVLVRMIQTEPLTKAHGRRFLRTLNRHLAQAILQTAGPEGCPARLSESVFAWLEPGLSAEEAQAKAMAWARGVKPVASPDHDRTELTLIGAVTAFPQDLPGSRTKDAAEGEDLARDLEERAGLALARALDMGPGHFLTLAELRGSLGRVSEALPLERAVVNLGGSAGLEEGMRFYVGSPGGKAGAYKAELILLSVSEQQATAEITALKDARFP